jgi:hypothetical protein
MKKISSMVIFLGSICSMGCRDIHCPEFPADLVYFPYSAGQELKFMNCHGDVHTFIISDKENTKAYSFGWNCKCVCDVHTQFNTKANQDTMSIKGRIEMDGRDDKAPHSISISFTIEKGNKYDFLRMDLQEKIPYSEVAKYLGDTLVIEKTNKSIVKKLVIAKNKGLISYITIDDEEWVLAE